MLTAEEQRKACLIAAKFAARSGYRVSPASSSIGRSPTDQCQVLVVVAPIGQGGQADHLHIVLEIVHNDQGRALRLQDLHAGQRETHECQECDVYHSDELYYDDPGDEGGNQCEGGRYWNDDGKGGFEPCMRTDTQWYEFWITGTAGWFCPTHWPYEEDMKAIRRARERAAKQSTEA